MAIRLLTSAEDLTLYEQWITTQADGTLWQSLAWKKYQEVLGREVRIYAEMDDAIITASAMVVVDTTTGGFSTWDIQRGPVIASSLQLLAFRNLCNVIIRDAKKEKCISLFLSPLHTLEADSLQLKTSLRHEQPEATRILDLTQSDEDILKQMHPKGRYNIKVAEKSAVHIEESTDVEAYAALSSDTAKRDGFIGGSTKRYRAFLTIPGSFMLLAYAPDTQKPIAGLVGIVFKDTGIYYYGASDYTHRSLMAPYLLQWEAIKHCKKAGCTSYDLLGIAPPNAPAHPWSGISDFKAKFGGEVVMYPTEQEIILQPIMRGLLQWKRRMMG